MTNDNTKKHAERFNGASWLYNILLRLAWERLFLSYREAVKALPHTKQRDITMTFWNLASMDAAAHLLDAIEQASDGEPLHNLQGYAVGGMYPMDWLKEQEERAHGETETRGIKQQWGLYDLLNLAADYYRSGLTQRVFVELHATEYGGLSTKTLAKAIALAKEGPFS